MHTHACSGEVLALSEVPKVRDVELFREAETCIQALVHLTTSVK